MKPAPLLAAIALSLSGFAQSVPTTLNYQGRLTDNTPQQTPLTATAAMSFELWDCAACSTPAPDRLWVEPATGTIPVAVTGGVFYVMLGSNGVPLPASVFSGGTQRWLQIIVNGEALTPRQQIGAAGYASQAENAASAVTANTAASATTAGNSLQLGGVAASGYQLATSAGCGAGQFLNAISPSGAATCAAPPPNNLSPPVALSASLGQTLLSSTNSGTGGAGAFATAAAGDPSPALSAASASTTGGPAFTASVTGTAGAATVTVNNPTNPANALFVTTNGTGRAGFFTINNAANGLGAVSGQSTGTGYAGYFSMIGSGNAVYGTASGSGGAGVFVASGTGPAGQFTIGNNADTSAAIAASTGGSGPAVSASSASGAAVSGSGTGADGIYGITTGSNGNGVHGVANVGTSAYGVWGQSGTGSGVVGTGAVAGVHGTATAATGAGVRAVGPGGAGTALQVENGAIRILGAGTGTSTAVFTHTVTSANRCGASANFTILDHPMLNGNPSAFVFATPRFASTGAVPIWGTGYGGGIQPISCPGYPNRWYIIDDPSSGLVLGSQYDVLIFLP